MRGGIQWYIPESTNKQPGVGSPRLESTDLLMPSRHQDKTACLSVHTFPVWDLSLSLATLSLGDARSTPGRAAMMYTGSKERAESKSYRPVCLHFTVSGKSYPVNSIYMPLASAHLSTLNSETGGKCGYPVAFPARPNRKNSFSKKQGQNGNWVRVSRVCHSP